MKDINQDLIDDFVRELDELKAALADVELLEKYYSQVPEEWKSDIQKMIKIKERIPKLMKIMSKINIL